MPEPYPRDAPFSDWIKTQHEICPTIGEIAVSFAAAEQALDECAIVIHKKYAEARKIAKRLPWALSEKLRFLERCYSEIDELAEDRKDMLLILKQMTELANHRNFLIHGAADPSSKAPVGQLKLRKISYEKSGPRFEERTYSIRDVWNISQQITIACVNAVVEAHCLKTNWRPPRDTADTIKGA